MYFGMNCPSNIDGKSLDVEIRLLVNNMLVPMCYLCHEEK